MGEYHKWDALSNTGLGHLTRSPAHYKAYLEEPPADTPAFKLGRAVHAAVLEPEIFKAQYAFAPMDLNIRTNAGKEELAELEKKFGVSNVLSFADYQMCLEIQVSVRKRKAATGLLGGDGECEVSVLWTDEASGIVCKARADRISPKLSGGTIVDLKTTGDASRAEFEKSIFNFGYHRQGAFYLAGFQAVGIDVRHFSIIAVEKKRPYAVAPYRLTDGAIDAGLDQINPLLELYNKCKENDEWPGYPDRVQDIALPSWAWSRIEEERIAV
jgi:exodeoxyribonuclease VIII